MCSSPRRNLEMRSLLAKVEASLRSSKGDAGRLRGFAAFSGALAHRDPRNLSWEEICLLGRERPAYPRFALVLVLTLLDEGLLADPCSDALRSFRPHIERALRRGLEKGDRLLPLYLCGGHIGWMSDPDTADTVVPMLGKRVLGRIREVGEAALNPETVLAIRDATVLLYGKGAVDRMPAMSKHQLKLFFSAYAERDPRSISWREECETYGREKGLKCQILALFVALLDRGLYSQDHAEALMRLKDPIERMLSEEKGRNLDDLVCGDGIESLYALPLNIGASREPWRLRFVQMETGSDFLKGLIADFLQSDGPYAGHSSRERVAVLLRSFGGKADGISGVEDLTASLFWEQAEFLRREFAEDDKWRKRHAAFLRSFYSYVSDAFPEQGVFEGATSMSSELLHSQRLTAYISEGHLVTSFAPGIDLGDAERCVLIVRGYDDLSTRVKAEDHVLLDASSLRCPSYRKEALAYACQSPQRLLASTGDLRYILQVLQDLFEAKSRKGYPNPALERLSREEALLIRKRIDRADVKPSTKTAQMNAIRGFFLWERDVRGRIVPEEFALDHLLDVPHGKGKSDARAIEDEHISAISALLAKKADEGHEWKLVNALFHIMLQTEFRIGQLCHLEIDCVRPAAKPGEYVIRSTSKTSGGEKEDGPITKRTLDVINYAIDSTDEIRRRFAARSKSRYIFLYQDRCFRLQVMNSSMFSARLAKCCLELGIDPPYTARNLRDTHSTKAIEWAREEGKSQLHALALTGHADIATDLEHYVDVDISKMVEATCDVLIGGSLQVDIDGKVAETIPDGAAGDDRVVEGGCGNCTAEYCAVVSPLPCLVCDHFVTTTGHEPYFMRAIEAVDAQLASAGSLHDAEDLTTIKRLLAKYLVAIARKKEAARG